MAIKGKIKGDFRNEQLGFGGATIGPFDENTTLMALVSHRIRVQRGTFSFKTRDDSQSPVVTGEQYHYLL